MSKEALVKQHYHLITRARRQVARYYREPEELEAEGALALLKAVERFDPNRGVKFQTYAGQVLRGKMREYLEAERGFLHPRREGSPGLEVGETPDGDDSLLERLIDPTPAPEEQALALLRNERVRAVVDALPARLRQVIRLRYWEGCSLPECGRRLGITHQSVRYHEQRAFERLQCQLKDWV